MYSLKKCSGMGLRWDIFDGTRRICIAHTEPDAKLIVDALNARDREVRDGR